MAVPGTAGKVTVTTSEIELLDFSGVPYQGASTIDVRVDAGTVEIHVPDLHAPGDWAEIDDQAYFRRGNRALTSMKARTAAGTADIRFWVAAATGQ